MWSDQTSLRSRARARSRATQRFASARASRSRSLRDLRRCRQMIGGEVARAALRLATLLVLLSVVTLFFQDRSSAGFVVSIMALVVSALFLTVVLVLARMSGPHAPAPRDNIGSKGYNGTDPQGDRSHGRGT